MKQGLTLNHGNSDFADARQAGLDEYGSMLNTIKTIAPSSSTIPCARNRQV